MSCSNTVHSVLELTLDDALLGGRVPVRTVRGHRHIVVPAGQWDSGSGVSGSQVLGLGFDVAACDLVFWIRLLSWVPSVHRL